MIERGTWRLWNRIEIVVSGSFEDNDAQEIVNELSQSERKLATIKRKQINKLSNFEGTINGHSRQVTM